MKYYITKNRLSDDGTFNARVIIDKNYAEDELINKILRVSATSSADLDLEAPFPSLRKL